MTPKWTILVCPACDIGPRMGLSRGACPECGRKGPPKTVEVVPCDAVEAERERIIARLVEMADTLDQDDVARTAETLRRAAALLELEGGL